MLIATHTLMIVFQMLIRHLESSCVDFLQETPSSAAELQFYPIRIFLHVCYLVFSFFLSFAINILSKAYEAMLAAVTLVVHNHSIIVL